MSSSNVSTGPPSGKALVQEKFNQLMNYGPVKSFFDKAEEKTGKNSRKNVDFVYTLVQYGLVPLVLLFGNTVVALLCHLLAYLYPTYSCLKAVRNNNEEEQRRWVEYWVVMSLLYVTDLILFDLLSTSVPLFWLARLSVLVLVWCIAPSDGSIVILARVVYPLFLKFGKYIDESVDKVKELFSEGVGEVKTAVTEVVEEATENVLAEAIGSVLDEAKEAIENVLDEAIAGEAAKDEASAGETELNGTIYVEIVEDGAIENKNAMDEADDSIQLGIVDVNEKMEGAVGGNKHDSNQIEAEIPRSHNEEKKVKKNNKIKPKCARASCDNQGIYRCSRCKAVYFCHEDCLSEDWPIHKEHCNYVYKANKNYKYKEREVLGNSTDKDLEETVNVAGGDIEEVD